MHTLLHWRCSHSWFRHDPYPPRKTCSTNFPYLLSCKAIAATEVAATQPPFMPRSRNSTPELRQLEESICSSAIKLALIAAMASMALVVGRMCPAYAATVNPPLVAPVEECGGYPEFEQDIPSLEPRTSVGTNPVGPSSDSMKSFMLKISKLRISPVSGTARQHEIKSTGRSFQRAFPGSYGQRIQREQGGESAGIDYEQLVKEHADTEQKRGMFTGDAWLGMMRLQRYNELLEKVEEQEKRCFDCTRNRRLLEQVWQTVANEYFDQYGRFSQADWSGELFKTLNGAGGLLQSKPETYKAAKDMVKSLGDPYSSFLIPEEYRLALHRPLPSELKYLAYQYTGVGMEIGKRSPNGGFEIIAPFAGSPAEEVGILGGERLLSVDGLSADMLTLDEAVTLLRGPIGSLVELEVASATSDASMRKLFLERRALPLPPLKMQMIDPGDGHLMAYLRLHYFTHDGTKRMASAIREGEALGVDGYILDLRNNPGGVFEEAIAMAALWLDCKDCGIAETVRSNAADVDDFTYTAGNLPHTIFLKHPGILTHAPLVTISNRNSASASEVLIGALQDNKRTSVIGEKTFGKGVVQYYFPMDDGSGLKLTVAKYLTPKRYDISKQGGLLPDNYCGDYPHAEGVSDKCIDEAVRKLRFIVDTERKEEERTGLPVPARMAYRWLPLNERRLWAKGSY